jgi:3-deoxy-D-manno-octulosonate 8-phosphate phosphatase KdsC-like HAD superfamily phosphatase
VLHVGDGPDDVPVFEAVGGSVKSPRSFEDVLRVALA